MALESPRLDVHSSHGGRTSGQSEVRFNRALDTQCLLDEIWDPVAMGAELVLELWVLAEVLQAGRKQASRRLLARSEEEGRRTHDV